MKKYTLMLAAFLIVAALAFAAVQIPVTGIGIGYASDQDAADQSADQQAAGNLQLQCAAGVIVSSSKSMDQCASLGDSDNPRYMCTVTYVGTCRVGR